MSLGECLPGARHERVVPVGSGDSGMCRGGVGVGVHRTSKGGCRRARRGAYTTGRANHIITYLCRSSVWGVTDTGA